MLGSIFSNLNEIILTEGTFFNNLWAVKNAKQIDAKEETITVGNIETSSFGMCDADIDLIGELYCITFIGQDFRSEDLDGAVANIAKHSGYKGFKGLKAKDESGNLIGFTYGYTSLPQQFYRKKLEEQLTKVQRVTWLSDCFEFVELAVSPFNKRLGVGSQLYNKLMDKLDNKTSILTTWVDNIPAINFYKNKGWVLIKGYAPVISEANPQVIMGKRIR